MKKFFFKYGLITLVVFTPWLIVLHLAGRFKPPFQETDPLDLVSLLINFGVIFLGIREARLSLGREVGFKQLFKIGAKLSVVFAIVLALVFAVYYQTLNQDLLNYVIKLNKLDDSAKAGLLVYDTILQFGSALFSSLLFSLAIATTLFFRNKRKAKS